MLLRKLKEYADQRLTLPPTLYSERPVRYIVDLDSDGRYLNMVDTADASSRETRRGRPRNVPYVKVTSAIRAQLLADGADYTFGYVAPDKRSERVADCHQAYLDLLRRCAETTGEPAVMAVLTFLENEPLSRVRLDEREGFDPSAVITFRVSDVFPVDLPSVQRFWAEVNDPAGRDAPVMQCVVCGQERPVLPRLQGSIKGVPGGQTAGTALISANAEAFESYGLKQSLIAPTCAECGERFTQAANALIAGQSTSLRLGGNVVFVFWTRQQVDFDFMAFLQQPDPQQVRALIDSVHTGRWQPGVDDTAFYATSLSGSGGRAVVRDWLDTTVGEVRRHLAAWFQRQRIVDAWGEPLPPLGIYRLAAGTVRDARNDLSPTTPRALLRAALTGSPVPPGILAQALGRTRAGEVQGARRQRVTAEQAALIKLMLSYEFDWKEEEMVQLDTENRDPAYLCGRLMAVIESVQRAALPGVNASVTDRFYGAASTTPAAVFSYLLRGARPHLAKLERDRPGAYHALEQRLEEIMGRLPASGFPHTLNLNQQGLFALGYYHQRAHDRAQARAYGREDEEENGPVSAP